MLTLGGPISDVQGISAGTGSSEVFRVSTNPNRPAPFKREEAFIVKERVVPSGFKLYVLFEEYKHLQAELANGGAKNQPGFIANSS